MPPKIIDEVFDHVEMDFANRNCRFIWASSADRRRIHDALRRTIRVYKHVVWIGERKAKSRPQRDPASMTTSDESRALDELRMRTFYEVIRQHVTASSSLVLHPPLFDLVLSFVIERLFDRGVLVLPPAKSASMPVAG